jgi:hypothetical protein
MKANLIFNLDDPDDRMAHLRATLSLNMAIALWEIQQMPKNLEDVPEAELWEAMCIKINEIMENNNINISEIIE